jgi:PAS domain S-box-containing protein
MRPISPRKQRIYDICILASIFAAVVVTYLSLSEGIYEVYPYFYLIPIVLIAFARPTKGIYGTVLVGWLYLVLILIIGLPNIQLYFLAMVWFYVFVSIGILLSTYAQVYKKEGARSCGTYYNSQAGAFRFDKASLRIIEANQKFANIVRDSCDDLLKKSLADYIPDAGEREEFLSQVRDNHRVRDIEVQLRGSDGNPRWALVSSADCDELATICTVVDITENKLAQESLTRANKKLNLLNNITRHDILNQLTGLIGYLEISRQETTDPKLLTFILKEEQAADAIRNQIIFTRDYQNIGVHAPQWQNIAEVVTLARAALDLPQVRVIIDLQPFEIYADPLLEKVFYNLIENSLRHGEHVTEIKIFIQDAKDGIDLIIEDNGAGIPDGAKEKIFRREYFKNTGLGLFLTREILAITNLTITEAGTFGRGARFVIHAPGGACRAASVVLTDSASPA